MTHLEEEKDLIERSKTDPAAFGVLFERYYPKILGYTFRRAGQWEAARDITSEVFFKAYRGLWKFRWAGVPVGAWFYRIAANEINMYFRSKKYVPASLHELGVDAGFDVAEDDNFDAEKEAMERQLLEMEDFQRIQAKILALPMKYQEPIALRYFEQKSVKEIGEILNKKEGTVKSLLSRGLEKLK